jgi:hypothetical protein
VATFAALVPDLDGAAELVGVAAQGDHLADEDGVDLVEDAVEADGAVLVDTALLREEEEAAEVDVGVGQADVGGALGPAVERASWTPSSP